MSPTASTTKQTATSPATTKTATKKTATKKATARKTATKKATAQKASGTRTAPAFSAEERSAMKERAAETRASRKGAGKGDELQALLDKIAEMTEPDRGIAARVHEVIMAAVPSLEPRTWYGMPAYAVDGTTVLFFQPASKFKARYSTLGFNDPAALDDGDMWPTAYAVSSLTPAVEKEIARLVRKAAG